jgi:putative zinc finger/helix-turn-helix YgiT family protein
MNAEKFCPACAEYREFAKQIHTEFYTVRGVKISMERISVEVCSTCGEVLSDEERDNALIEAAYSEYRALKGLLSPTEVQSVRKRYGLSQQSFAVLLGMGEATINRYEGGALQDEAHDWLIRACRESSFMETVLERNGNLLSPRQLASAKKALANQEAAEGAERPMASCLTYANEVSTKTGFRKFAYERYAAVVTWFIGHVPQVGPTKLNKLLYYADVLYYRRTAVSLTGSPYRRIEYGPVPVHYGTLNDFMEADGYIAVNEVDYSDDIQGQEFKTGPHAPDVVALDATAIAVLEVVASNLGKLSAKEVSRRSHLEPGWIQTPEKQLISYEIAKDLKAITA